VTRRVLLSVTLFCDAFLRLIVPGDFGLIRMAGEGFAQRRTDTPRPAEARPQPWLGGCLRMGWGRYQVTRHDTNASPCSETHFPADRSKDVLI
jgi:hypothetical protein